MGKCARNFAENTLRWFTAWSLLILATGSQNSSTVQPSVNGTSTGYAWSSWGSWSPCSRSCGGGVSVQKRSCLSRTSNVTAAPTLESQTPSRSPKSTFDCSGSSQRYHECNTLPCPGEAKDLRSEQCSSFDKRPFRGRYYNWIPYVEGDSPCILNCRPLGQHFYASLGLAADGTPCTKPGFRAICVQGTCKVVGREGVLAGGIGRGEARCGRRLVSGLFARPRLPLGYSHVATVPRGACRLNVSEMLPSENYIALKVTNGSYIMNGEFAVSAPGSYEAVGARFQYSRIGALDSVFAYGPLQQAIDIMVLYTQPNPNIKYEYLTESLTGEIDSESQTEEVATTPVIHTKHIRRHHNFKAHSNNPESHPDYSGSREDGYSIEDNFVRSRSFVWKILNFTPCSRSCGGGFQLGKFKCVETNSNGQDREVSPVHCSGSPPPGRRKRCGAGQCPPRWRTTVWSSCPKCGPAERSRIVGCVQDHSKGISKVSDQKCPAPKPISKDICDIPDCNTKFDHKHIVVKQSKRRDQVDSFHDGPVYTVSVDGTEEEIGPEYSFSAAGGWLSSDWSECVGWCVGGALQTRGVICGDPAGCAPRRAPDASRSCTNQLTCEPFDGQWFTGEWSVCTSSCNGRQVRGVLCIGGTGRHLKDSACKSPKPELEQECGDLCGPAWYFGEWSQCQGSCDQGGIQRRTVYCARADNVAALESECTTPKPDDEKACALERCGLKSSIDLGSESQRIVRNEIILTPITTTVATTTTESLPQDCVDKLTNCALAVQARLCHYNYYIQNCCNSCRR